MVRKLWLQRIAPLITEDWRRLTFLILLLSILATGLVLGWGKILQGLLLILTHPSQLISDYVEIAGPGPAMVNAALVGLMGLGLVMLLRVDITGPTTAAIFTMVGFGLFGKNIFNYLPIVAGVWAMPVWKGWSYENISWRPSLPPPWPPYPCSLAGLRVYWRVFCTWWWFTMWGLSMGD